MSEVELATIINACHDMEQVGDVVDYLVYYEIISSPEEAEEWAWHRVENPVTKVREYQKNFLARHWDAVDLSDGIRDIYRNLYDSNPAYFCFSNEDELQEVMDEMLNTF